MSGEIDAATAPVIEQRVRGLLSAGDVVVDCRAVTFLDVAGLRMFARIGDAAVTTGAVMRLLCSPAVIETFDVCGVRELPGVVLNPDDHDSPGSLR
nr:STAS domain-containing protein [uncultured Actinoplanes sp.]